MSERKVFEHYKGGLYQLLHNGAQMEKSGPAKTLDDYQVVYRDISTGAIWVRPSHEFYGTTDDGKPRFREIGWLIDP